MIDKHTNSVKLSSGTGYFILCGIIGFVLHESSPASIDDENCGAIFFFSPPSTSCLLNFASQLVFISNM